MQYYKTYLELPNKNIYKIVAKLFGSYCFSSLSLIYQKRKNMTAQELKIGDTFRRQGYKFTVVNIKPDSYKNGTEALRVECTTNNGKTVDSFFSFKLTTKVK